MTKKSNNLKLAIFFGCFAVAIISTIYIVYNIFYFDSDIKIYDEDEFILLMNKYGCSVEKSEGNSYVAYLYDTTESCPYMISYAVYNDERYKDDMFAIYESIFDYYDGENTNLTHIDLGNDPTYEEMTFVGDYYLSLISYNNSILLISANAKDIEIVKQIRKDMGYCYELSVEYVKYLGIPVATFLIGVFAVSFLNKKEHNRARKEMGLGY